jgi:hypothetical protein
MVFYAASTLLHILVIVKIIPYAWVNGGRSESFEQQVSLSSVSIVIIAFVGLLTWYLMTQKNRKFGIVGLSIITIWWAVSLLLQLLGTQFEKLILAPLHAVGVLAYIQAVRAIKN